MTDREAMIECLTEGDPGISREEAERRMLDDDLWLAHPERRWTAPSDEEAVEQWETVHDLVYGLAHTLVNSAGYG
jgi:hypothetical protein